MKDIMQQKIKVIALFGKSGSGKDTILKYLLRNLNNINLIINTTTRPKRDYEENGKDYYFITREEFENKEWLQQANFNNWFYGTSINSLDKNKINIGVFSLAAIKQLQDKKELEVLPVYISASDKTRLLRQLAREENPNCVEICRRFFTDAEDFKDFSYCYKYENENNNKDFNKLLAGLNKIIDFKDF